MDILHISLVVGALLAKTLSILAIIYLPMIVGMKWLPRIDNAGMFLMPGAWYLPMITGMIVGGTMVYFNLDEELFTVDNIFRTDGPWNLTYSAFIRDRVNPFNYYLEPVLNHASFQGFDLNIMILLLVAAACFGLMVYRAVSIWHSFGAWRGIVFGFAVVVWSCYMTIFGVCLVLWLLHLLNFWSLALITLLVHLYRTHSLPFHASDLMSPVFGGHGHGGHGHGDHGHGGGHGDHGGGHGGGHDSHGGGHDSHGGGHDSHGGGHDSHGGGHGGGHGGHDDHHLDAVHPLRGGAH